MAKSAMNQLVAVRISFEVIGEHQKKAGTTVDITFREDGDILAYLLNAGHLIVWQPGDKVDHELLIKQRELERKELADCCIRLSWLPEQDENVHFNFHLLVIFENGTKVERAFLDKKVATEEGSKEYILGL